VGPRAGLENVQKISSPPGFNPQTVQPRARHYTDYAKSTEHKRCVSFLSTVFVEFLIYFNKTLMT
jgi:hypothetical protein